MNKIVHGQSMLTNSIRIQICFLAVLQFMVVQSSLESQVKSPDHFTFVRIRYNMGEYSLGFLNRYGSLSWEVDHPDAEEHFMEALARGTSVPVAQKAIAHSLTDSQLFEYSFAYIVEVGFLRLNDVEAEALREWLLRGGFLLVDDFHGILEWEKFMIQIRKVFPERPVKQIPSDHPVFHCYYDFDKYPQVPGLGSIINGRNYEKGGKVPQCRGIFDEQGRLMVLINHNVDLGDSWEHAGDYRYPRDLSLLGYQLGINYVVYALTH